MEEKHKSSCDRGEKDGNAPMVTAAMIDLLKLLSVLERDSANAFGDLDKHFLSHVLEASVDSRQGWRSLRISLCIKSFRARAVYTK